MERRGLTPIVGFVLLMGIVAVGAMSLFVAGMALAEATQSSAEQEQAENSMAQFASTASDVAVGEISTGEFELRGADDGTTRVDPEAGHIKMWIDTENGSETLLNDSLGVYTYENADGEKVAFQGGGVWGSDADGTSYFVNSPGFEYRNNPDPTLTYNHMKVVGNGEVDNPKSGSLRTVASRDKYPTGNQSNPLVSGQVYIQLSSEYCGGWEDYFESRTDSGLIEGCQTTGSTDEGELRLLFEVPFKFEGLDSDPVVASEINDKHSAFQYDKDAGSYDNAKEGDHSTQSASGVIESKIETCEGDADACESLSTDVDESGTYYSDGVDGGDYYFDTTDGEIEVVVDGDFNANSVDITGSNPVTLFVKGDVMQDPGVNYNNNGEAERFRILVHSGGYQVGCFKGDPGCGAGGGGSNIHAFIYAPNSEVNIGPGNTHYKGGFIADEVNAHSGGANFNPDSDVTDIEFEYESGGEPFYYLHVSETDLAIEET